MAWRVARSLNVLLEQINTAYPGRSRASDGSIGDTAHASRSSDHNPWVRFPSSPGLGIVTARDFTHDPSAGFNAHAFADRILAAQDPRLKYVISAGRIGSGPGGISPGKWRPYNGPNPHTKHVHVSVVADPRADGDHPWAGVTTGDVGSRVPDFTEPTTPDEDVDDLTPEQAQKLDDLHRRVVSIEHYLTDVENGVAARSERTEKALTGLVNDWRTWVTSVDGLGERVRRILVKLGA